VQRGLKKFAHPGKCVGHSLKNLGLSQKTLRPPWCPKLVTGLPVGHSLETPVLWHCTFWDNTSLDSCFFMTGAVFAVQVEGFKTNQDSQAQYTWY